MINPRLGLLALQALNPKRKKKNMSTKASRRRHMAWVRGHKRRKRNPYPMAGSVTSLLNPRRRRKHHRKSNPHRRRRRNPVTSVAARGFLGLPPLMPVVWGMAGFSGTAMVQGFVDTLVPASFKTNADGTPNLITKYVEIGGSIVAITWAAKQFLGYGPASLLGIGGGIYAATQLAHDFAPGWIPGMHAYTPLRSYTPVRRSSSMGRSVGNAGGGFPQLAAPDHGQANSPDFAPGGGMNIVNMRFRRFA